MSGSEGTSWWPGSTTPGGGEPAPTRRRRWPWVALGVLVFVLAGGSGPGFAGVTVKRSEPRRSRRSNRSWPSEPTDR